jgi:hypothetical protein
MAVDSDTANSRWNKCNDSAYPKNSRSAPKNKTAFLASSLMESRWQDGKPHSRLRLPHAFQRLRQDVSSRYVDITLYGSSQLFGSLLTTHCFCLAIVRRIYHCDWSGGGDFDVAILLWVRDTRVHWYFSRQEPNQTKPTNQKTDSASLSMSLSQHQPHAYPTTARA